MARSFEAASLDFKHVVAAVAIRVDPAADGIATHRRLDLGGPIAPGGIDEGVLFDPVDEDVSGRGRDNELLRLEPVGIEGHAHAEAGRAQPVADAALCL